MGDSSRKINKERDKSNKEEDRKGKKGLGRELKDMRKNGKR